MHGWCFAMCSMEKRATDHARQLVEKIVGRPFFDLPYARGLRRMSERELDAGLDWVDDRFHLIRRVGSPPPPSLLLPVLRRLPPSCWPLHARLVVLRQGLLHVGLQALKSGMGPSHLSFCRRAFLRYRQPTAPLPAGMRTTSCQTSTGCWVWPRRQSTATASAA